MVHFTFFSFEFFYEIFKEDASLRLLYRGAKKSKMTKNSNQGGGGFCLKGEVQRKMNFTYVLGFVVLRDVVKVFPVSSSSFARKTTGRNQVRSHSGA